MVVLGCLCGQTTGHSTGILGYGRETFSMSQFGTNDYQTVTVLRSQALGRADGRAVIRLDTRELGAIAFEVDRGAIGALRRDLSIAEAFLRQKSS